MKRVVAAFAALLVAAPALADQIETLPNHASLDLHVVTSAVLSMAGKETPANFRIPVPVRNETECAKLAFTLAAPGISVAAACMGPQGNVYSSWLCRPWKQGDQNREQANPTCLRIRL